MYKKIYWIAVWLVITAIVACAAYVYVDVDMNLRNAELHGTKISTGYYPCLGDANHGTNFEIDKLGNVTVNTTVASDWKGPIAWRLSPENTKYVWDLAHFERGSFSRAFETNPPAVFPIILRTAELVLLGIIAFSALALIASLFIRSSHKNQMRQTGRFLITRSIVLLIILELFISYYSYTETSLALVCSGGSYFEVVLDNKQKFVIYNSSLGGKHSRSETGNMQGFIMKTGMNQIPSK